MSKSLRNLCDKAEDFGDEMTNQRHGLILQIVLLIDSAQGILRAGKFQLEQGGQTQSVLEFGSTLAQVGHHRFLHII